ncbi:MAG TPA: hypothetical protein HA346_00845 [Thermoplasmata archaeon]|nr:hypothetical protein [Thermoplasmata archaeon]
MVRMDMPSKKERETNKIGSKEKQPQQTHKPTLAGVLLLMAFFIDFRLWDRIHAPSRNKLCQRRFEN